jgi:hypothetical protein
MGRRMRTSFAVLASAVAGTVMLACSSAPEEKIVRDFFRASRMRDSVTLGSFATASFDLRKDGQVQSFKVTSIGDERRNPMPLKNYSRAIDEAIAAQEAFTQQKLAYQNGNLRAIERVESAENKRKPIPRQDAAVQAAWNEWRDNAGKHAKAVSDARRRLANMKGLAELSLSQPNGASPDVSQMSGEMIEKDVTVDATVRTPDGQAVQKSLILTLSRAQMTDAAGKTTTGRWIVTAVREPKGQTTTS